MRLPVKITVLVAALAAAGCSGGAWTPSPSPVGLWSVLAQVRATDDARAYLEYGNGARVAELVAEDRDRFLRLTGLGLGNVGQYSQRVEEALGVDLTGLGAAVQVGQPPNQVGAVWGAYDADALNARLADLDIERSERDGATYWRAGADHEIDLADGPFAGVVPTSEFNNIRVAPGSFAFSPARAGLDRVVGGGDGSLAGDPAIGAAAACLGDVVVAVIVGEYSIGVRVNTVSDVTEVICVASDDPDRTGDAVEEQLADGVSASGGRPWSELLPDAKVERTGDLVRVTTRTPADRPVGTVVSVLLQNEIGSLTGAG